MPIGDLNLVERQELEKSFARRGGWAWRLIQASSALLEHCGARVTCASSAAEAVRLAGAGFHHDCVVSDLELPDHDGLWLVSEIKRMAKPTALAPWTIPLTGSARPGIEGVGTRFHHRKHQVDDSGLIVGREPIVPDQTGRFRGDRYPSP